MSSSQTFDADGAGTGLLTRPPDERRARRGSPGSPTRRRGTGGRSGPPEDPGDGWGRGGGGDGEGEGEPRRPGDALKLAASELGLGLALVASTTLFVMFAAVYLFLRSHADTWPPPGFPGAPNGLWSSSVLLAASSAALATAARELNRGGDVLLRRSVAWRWLLATLALGVSFVVAQGIVWSELFGAGVVISSHAYATGFYSLTVIHALHVLGGMAYLAYLLWRTRIDPNAWGRPFRLASVYWHFMGGVWVVLFGVLYFTD